METSTFYVCPDCEHAMDEAPEGPAYECSSCGTAFSREMTENMNHRCPECNKFGSKIGDYGCPECGSEMEVQDGIKCPHCDKIITGEEG